MTKVSSGLVIFTNEAPSEEKVRFNQPQQLLKSNITFIIFIYISRIYLFRMP
jgi:hypothetical protein